MIEMAGNVEEKVGQHLREKAGYKARKNRSDSIKEDIEDDRAFRCLKSEQGRRSGREEIFDFIHIF